MPVHLKVNVSQYVRYAHNKYELHSGAHSEVETDGLFSPKQKKLKFH